MKKLFSLVFAALLAFSLTACGSSEKTASGSGTAGDGSNGKQLADKLYLFNWSEYLPKSIIKGFEKKYGVDVVYSTYASNSEMLAKLRSGTVPYDLVVPSDYYVKRMAEHGLLQKIDMKNVPNFKNISDQWKDLPFDPGNQYSVPYMYGTTGIAYNKKKIDKPTSWKALWNPKYKGHVIMLKAAGEAFNVPLQLLGNDVSKPKDISKQELKKAGGKLKDLASNVLAYDSTPAPQLVTGEAWIADAYSGAAAKAWKKNPDIGFVLPKEGGVIWMDNFAIPKTSKNPYTAEVFINYLLKPKVSKKLSEAYPYSNPN
ncbi:MAG TPA: spermidine/putrescine ABC transporter substrate-binding protein, partial [Bacillales bacterium]|nr:spermidine/putrescine ABC transporter substrate-binding protein [Bacillales bacterium]